MCQQKAASNRSQPPANLSEDVPTPGGLLVTALNQEPETLNPLTALSEPARQIISLIFLRLARVDSDLVTFRPELAYAWDTLSAGKTIRFHLRTDVFWQDEVPVTAKDVAFTFYRQSDPTYGWDGLPFKKNITQVEIINDSTIDFHFKRPNLSMILDAAEGEILPAHLLSRCSPQELAHHEFNHQPLGNGPYQLVEWIPQQMIILERNPRYFDQPRPYLLRIVFKIIPDNVLLTRQILGGELDLAENLLPRDFQRLKSRWLKGQSVMRPMTYLGRQYDFIAWNPIAPQAWSQAKGIKIPQDLNQLAPHPLFSDAKVRQALTMAIDRRNIGAIINGELSLPMDGPIPLIMWAYNPTANKVWHYNPTRAQQVLLTAGWRDTDGDGIIDKNGVPFQFEMLTNSGNIRREQALTLIQEQLKKIGVAMVPRTLEGQLLVEKHIIPRKFDALLFGWNVSLKMELTGLFHSSTFFHPFHFCSYYSPQFDTWEEQALNANSHREAQIYWDKIATLLSTELPYTWLYYQINSVVIHKRFQGVVIDKRGIYQQLPYWWIPPSDRIARDKYYHPSE
jgi:peptide/nickel transport system substrate-binding protein